MQRRRGFCKWGEARHAKAGGHLEIGEARRRRSHRIKDVDVTDDLNLPTLSLRGCLSGGEDSPVAGQKGDKRKKSYSHKRR
ncbi:MAG: hypothetical protein C4320_07035 [Armatimonadota bacterium]